MSTPLVDIDANPRQPGFRPIKEGSKIPSPPKLQRSGSKGRRSPFSVSTTGSPCYTAMSTTCKAVRSPTPASKLPRKSTPTQSAFSKSYTYGSRPATPRTSLPRARGGHKLTAIATPCNLNTIKSTPPLRCNKPLPSPPIAQIVNPASPPKAQRTLVDAEAGTPTGEDWPILQPEDVSPSKSPAPSTSDELPHSSVCEGSAFRRNGIAVLESRVTTPLSVNNRTPLQTKSDPSTEDNNASHEELRQTTEPRTFSSMNPYAKSFHAFSSDTEVATDSPLAHKKVVIPPRISSKRSCLPSPETAIAELPAQLPSASLRPVKSGSTKWPVLGAGVDHITKEQPDDEDLTSHQRYLTTRLENVEPASFGGADVTQSHYGSIDSVTTQSLAAESSLIDKPEIDYEGTVRVKRLSWHLSNHESGPTLRISADADAVLLGRDDSIPAIPALPDQVLEKTAQERSLRTLAGRVSKQVLVKMTSTTGSRTPTPSSTDTEIVESKPVKVTPIRSTQPPRKPSTGGLSKKSASVGTPASMEVTKDQEELVPSQADPRSSFDTSRTTSLSLPKFDTTPQTSSESQKESYETGNYSTTLQDGVPRKAMQVLGADAETPQSATRRRLPMTWITPKSATFNLQKSVATRSKTSPSLLSAGRFHNRMSASSTRSPSSALSSLARSTPPQAGARQPGPSRLGATEPVTQMFDPVLCNNSSKKSQAVEKTTVDTSLRIKAKRSFRIIFHGHEPKATPQPAREQNAKRSSTAGSVLAQRIRNSANFSKLSSARPSEPKSGIKQDIAVSSDSVEALGKETDRQAALSALESDSAELSTQPTPVTHYDTVTVVHKILDHVTSMREESPDRLRGLEIAEVVLHAIECSKEAKLSAELARKHARDAELNAERAGIELKQLKKLCEPSFDDETMQEIKQMITAAVVIKPLETTAQ